MLVEGRYRHSLVSPLPKSAAKTNMSRHWRPCCIKQQIQALRNLVQIADVMAPKGKRQGDDNASIAKKPKVVISAEGLTCDACGKTPKDQ
eukprot:579968-Amphidinium_carterae.3